MSFVTSRHRIAIFACLGLLFAPAAAMAQEELSYADLARRLLDTKRLALLPQQGETTAQQSSYDRASRYDEETDTYIDWAANNDGFTPQFIRKEGDKEVLAEIDGPGVIWRIWSANPKEGHVRVFIDGQESPAIDLPFQGYFNGENAPFDHPGLVFHSAGGKNSYVPIPFQESVKIVADPGWGQYYHFTYSTFPEGTQVPSFTGDLDDEAKAALQEVGDFYQGKVGQNPAGNIEGEETGSKQVSVEAGQTATVADLSGEGAITAIRVKMEFDNKADEIAALRELALSIKWDGEDKPAVWSPLGDFFGSAMGVTEYRSLMAGMGEDGFYAYWYMPYAQGATIELTNDGHKAREVTFEISRAPLEGEIGDYGRFHAKWHRDVFPVTRADRWPDWTVLKTQGRGKFCGMMLHVWNPTAGHNWKYGRDGGWWWGEGDEKFFVDGEKFPSTFGTGTEDYFGYAWCTPDYYDEALINQTTTQNNKGHQSVNRWQVADAIPFQSSFDGYVEKYYPNHWPTLYAAVAYWYLDPEGEDPHDPVTDVKQRTDYYDLTPATEGENLEVANATGGTTQIQTLMENRQSGTSLWSGGSQVWWKDAEVDDELTLSVPVARPGTYKVKVGMTEAPDYGIGQLSFAGKTPLAPIDFHNGDLRAVEVYLGEFELEEGTHELKLKLTGKNDDATDQLLGVDYVKVVPVEYTAEGHVVVYDESVVSQPSTKELEKQIVIQLQEPLRQKQEN